MTIIEDIPVRFDPDRVRKELHLSAEKIPLPDLLELIESASSLIRARAAVEVAYVRDHGSVSTRLDGATFASGVLAAKLKTVERVFPFVITIGKELEDSAGSSGDLLRQYSLEGLGDMALRQARESVASSLVVSYGLEKIASLSPGSLKDWPLSEQKPLFSLFPEGAGIGVRLTESLLMIPRKSVSGVFFPTEESFFACQLCPRDNCPGRKAEYDKSLESRLR